jgi:hypothetical protein
MSWLNFFQTTQTQHHTFGRGINATISPDEEALFIRSYEAFEAKEILNAYGYFFESLINYTNGVSNENISFTKDDEKLEFTLYQGCAKVTGVITPTTLYAEASIVKKQSANVALKRYILERNYQLTYAYYFEDEEYVKIKLYHDNITMSPQKVFFPLREIALNADFDKEHILHEFAPITLEQTQHTKALPNKELQIKYDFLQKWIGELESKVLTLPSNDNASMQAFLYLNLLFKIDYLLVPKYAIYQKLSKVILEYFSQENTSIEAKNEELKRYTQKLKKMSFEKFSHNFYSAKYTFNPSEKSSFEDVVSFINESLVKIRWYKNNRYAQVIPTIYRYIAFYTLYNYGLSPVVKELLHLLVEVQHADYFEALEYKPLYLEQTQSFSKRTICTKLDQIISTHAHKFKNLESFSSELNFESMNEFSNSFYQHLQLLNLEEV